MLEDLNTKFIGKKIIWTKETISTNTDAKNSGECDGTVFITDFQTGGKGRLGRQWVSPPKTALMMSILLKPKKKIEYLQCVTLCAGLAVCNAVNSLCNLKSLIKWPNDIVIGTKKVCGILAEAVTDNGKISSVAVGIGINVTTDTFPADISYKATSLLLETGITYKREALAKAVLTEFEKYYKKLLSGNLDEIIKEYEKSCVNIGRESVFSSKDGEINGKAVGISESGELLISLNGKITSVSSGEVSVNGIYEKKRSTEIG